MTHVTPRTTLRKPTRQGQRLRAFPAAPAQVRALTGVGEVVLELQGAAIQADIVKLAAGPATAVQAVTLNLAHGGTAAPRADHGTGFLLRTQTCWAMLAARDTRRCAPQAHCCHGRSSNLGPMHVWVE